MNIVPPALYKYQSRTAGRAALTGGTLRWSTPAILNDPFDIQFDLGMQVDEDRVCEMALEKLWRCYTGEILPSLSNPMGLGIALLRTATAKMTRDELAAEFEPAFREGLTNGKKLIPETLALSRAIVATSKILCLTDMCDSQLMWAHYAESHKGLVLMFSTNLDSVYALAKPVEYVSAEPRLYDENSLSDVLAGLATINVASALDRMIYTKSEPWAYEHEWRVFAGDGRNRDAPFEDVPFAREELVGVVWGARMAVEEQPEFEALAKAINPNISIYQSTLTPGFGLSVIKRS